MDRCILFMQLLADDHLGCFYIVASIHNAAKGILVQVLCDHVFLFLLVIYLEVLNHIR